MELRLSRWEDVALKMDGWEHVALRSERWVSMALRQARWGLHYIHCIFIYLLSCSNTVTLVSLRLKINHITS